MKNTENTINTENNKLVVEFMGLKPINVFGKFNISKDHVSVSYHDENEAMNSFCKSTKYHSDWNWLMEVIDKIESLDYWIEIMSGAGKMVTIGKINTSECILYTDGKTAIEATYNAIIKFINYYNLDLKNENSRK